MADSSSLAWLWVIEYLARFQQLDPSILHDLIDEAPELSEDLGKTTREMVALRCLEQLFGTSDEVANDVTSVTDAKDTFDFSRSCQDVLQCILKERSVSDLKMSGVGLLKWDVRPFIMHKRASMPKCALEQLKVKILEGTHTGSLMELSGLLHKNDGNHGMTNDGNDRMTLDCGYHKTFTWRIDSNGSDTQIVAPEEDTISLNGKLEGDSHHRNLLPSKRNRSGLDKENLPVDYQEDQGGLEDGDLHVNVKRCTHDASCVNNSSEQALVSQSVNVLVEDSSEAMVRVTEKESCHVEGEFQVGGLGECRHLDNGHDTFVAVERLERSPNADADGAFQHDQFEKNDNANNMVPDISGDGRACQSILVDEVNKAEPSTSNVPSMRTLQIDSVDDTNANNNCGNQVKSPHAVSLSKSSGRTTVRKEVGCTEHLYEEELSTDDDDYRHERFDVAMEKSHFLSSQCTLSHVSQDDWTELNLCVKCNKDGQLLVCSAVGCPLTVHEKCLGSSPRFDEKGNFYCPFCAYSHAISEYLKAKKEASLARKELGAFIHPCTKRSNRKVHGNLKWNKDEDLLHKNHESGNLGEKESDQTNSKTHAYNVNGQLKNRRGDRQPMEPIISCPDVNLVANATHGSIHISSGEKECEEIAPKCPDRQGQVCIDPKCNGDNQISENQVVFCSNKKQTERGSQEEALVQQGSLFEKPACAINVDVEISCKGNKEGTSNYSTRFRGKGKQYVYPALPQVRRNKLPWTATEEKVLKEGVQKFSTTGDRVIPWKKILEYGSPIFFRDRTTVDLKDKWRNICKGSPKCK